MNKILTKILTITNGIYLITSICLLLAGCVLVGVSVYDLVTSGRIEDSAERISTILNAISLLVIAVAIFDVGKYILEEEIIATNELRKPKEARKTLTKFAVIIFVAVSLESLVHIFIAGKTDITLLIYPAIVLFVAVLLLIGLGIYMKMSVEVEDKIWNRKPRAKVE